MLFFTLLSKFNNKTRFDRCKDRDTDTDENFGAGHGCVLAIAPICHKFCSEMKDTSGKKRWSGGKCKPLDINCYCVC